MSNHLCYTDCMMKIKNTNTTAENVALACKEKTKHEANLRFRQLEHAAQRGTTNRSWAKLEIAWELSH